MKKRIIAFLLCFALVMPILPAFAVTTEDITLSATSVTLPQYEKKTITAAPGADVQVSAYQWQIKVPGTDLWVDISGAKGATLELSYAMVASLLQGDQAQIRCEAVIGGETVETEVVTVTMDYTSEPAVVTESEPVEPKVLTQATVVESSVSAPASNAKQEETVEDDSDLAALEEARNAAITAEGEAEAAVAAAQEKLTAAQNAEAAAKAALDQAQADYDAAVAAAVPAETEAEDAETTEAAPAVTVDSTARDAAKAAYADAQNATAAAQKELDEANAALTAAQAKTAEAQAALDAATPTTPILARFAARNVDDGIMTADAEDVSTEKFSILINYVFGDGEQAASSWSATLAAGTDYIATVKSPEIVGYTPDQAEVQVNVTDIAEDKTITVTYSPALVNYTVKHYQQNLNDDNYTLVKEESKQGYTESPVGEGQEKDYTGFYSLLYDTTTAIAADGSTEVEIYYDRYYYLMTFDLDGGYGVEPIYARYGAPVSVGEPTKAGYSFGGWKDSDSGTVYQVASFPYSTMPAKKTEFIAQWTAGTTTFMVVFWYENANDDGYTTVGNVQVPNAVPGSEVSSAAYRNASFENRDDDNFTYNANKAETVTVAGDGSTVLNVYFTRNQYTLTFVGDLIICGYVEHEHSHDECCTKTDWHLNCNYDKCPVGYEHEHTYGGWGTASCYDEDETILTVTAKYDSDISYVWTTDPIKSMLDDGYVFQSSVTSKYYSFLEKMPDQDITMTATLWSGNTYKWYYYLEVLPGADTTGLAIREDGGRTYYLYDDTTVNGSGLSLTYDEDYYPITGFTQRDTTVPNFNNREAYLYYTRNSYDLSFVNYGTPVSGAGGTFLYQADISNKYFEPQYPSTLEAGAYVFDGWYTSPFFGDTKFEFTTTDENGVVTKATMPAYDRTLYARWVPVKHNVNIYLTSAMNADDKIGETQVVAHREFAVEPEEPDNGAYTFVGWFYMDGSTEKAFDFSMPVTQDLNLYAKWSSNTLMEYTIHYELADGTKIGEDTVGSALAGSTKTFEAKTGDDLFEGYQSGYFPTTNSHSLTIDIEEPAKNEFTFIYVPKEKLPYKVMYLEYDGDYVYDGTENALSPEKRAETRDAVITETFVPITGYMPDAYQKRLILSADESQNVIIFWYVKDDVHAPVQVIHYIQNAEGEGYTVYQESTDLNGLIGKTYSTAVLTITGYDYDHATANGNAVEAENGKVTGTVTNSGLKLELYYNRELHPYEFKFLEQGSNEVLADSVTGTARYGSQVSKNAKNIPGYTLVSPDAQAITIQREDGDAAVKNVRIFYYTEQEVTINYEVVGPAGCGAVSPESETLKVRTGEAVGSTATASTNIYKFVGWYDNETCEGEALSTDEKYVPTKEAAELWIDGTTYYAKFEYNLTKMTITKQLTKASDKNESFIFSVSGAGANNTVVIQVPAGATTASIILAGLTVGEKVTVTEIDSYNRDYTADVKTVTSDELTAEVNGIVNVTISNEPSNANWLTESDHIPNWFKN